MSRLAPTWLVLATAAAFLGGCENNAATASVTPVNRLQLACLQARSILLPRMSRALGSFSRVRAEMNQSPDRCPEALKNAMTSPL